MSVRRTAAVDARPHAPTGRLDAVLRAGLEQRQLLKGRPVGAPDAKKLRAASDGSDEVEEEQSPMDIVLNENDLKTIIFTDIAKGTDPCLMVQRWCRTNKTACTEDHWKRACEVVGFDKYKTRPTSWYRTEEPRLLTWKALFARSCDAYSPFFRPTMADFEGYLQLGRLGWGDPTPENYLDRKGRHDYSWSTFWALHMFRRALPVDTDADFTFDALLLRMAPERMAGSFKHTYRRFLMFYLSNPTIENEMGNLLIGPNPDTDENDVRLNGMFDAGFHGDGGTEIDDLRAEAVTHVKFVLDNNEWWRACVPDNSKDFGWEGFTMKLNDYRDNPASAKCSASTPITGKQLLLDLVNDVLAGAVQYYVEYKSSNPLQRFILVDRLMQLDLPVYAPMCDGSGGVKSAYLIPGGFSSLTEELEQMLIDHPTHQSWLDWEEAEIAELFPHIEPDEDGTIWDDDVVYSYKRAMADGGMWVMSYDRWYNEDMPESHANNARNIETRYGLEDNPFDITLKLINVYERALAAEQKERVDFDASKC